MLTGTGPNLIFVGLMPEKAGINFGSFALMNFPVCVIMTILAWGWLWFQYIRPYKKSTPEQLEIVTNIINREHASLGPMTWAEKTVGSVFAILAFLWLTRNPGFVSGWADLPGLNIRDDLGRPFITDASVAVFMAFWLFIDRVFYRYKIPKIGPLSIRIFR